MTGRWQQNPHWQYALYLVYHHFYFQSTLPFYNLKQNLSSHLLAFKFPAVKQAEFTFFHCIHHGNTDFFFVSVSCFRLAGWLFVVSVLSNLNFGGNLWTTIICSRRSAELENFSLHFCTRHSYCKIHIIITNITQYMYNYYWCGLKHLGETNHLFSLS